MLLGAWSTPTLKIAVPQRNHFTITFLSFLQISHWWLSTFMWHFRHGLHQPSICTGWNCFYWNGTAILVPTEIQQRKKAGTCCCAEGSADSSQPSRKAPLHSLHCPDMFRWFCFPTKNWTGSALWDSQLPKQRHMHPSRQVILFNWQVHLER